MSGRTCDNCKKYIAVRFRVCPYCQHPQPEKSGRGSNVMLGAGAVIVVAALAVGGGFYYQSYQRQRADDLEAERKQAFVTQLQARCQTLVSQKARYPSKTKFTESSYIKAEDGKDVVLGTVDLYNRAGAYVPHKFYCAFNEDAEGEVFLQEEGTF